MKKYLLLRNNQQSGPHSFEELTALGLGSLDLIWIEGRSASWAYPTEIEELKGLEIIEPERIIEQKRSEREKTGHIFVSLPSNFSQKRRWDEEDTDTTLPVNQAEPVLETHLVQPLPELRERQQEVRQPRKIWEKKLFPANDAMKLAAVFFGLVFGAVII